jgi:cholesterol 7-dehydrogenase
MRKQLINELRKRRKIGETPPPYPNGWFIIIESKEVGKTKAKEVSCLGMRSTNIIQIC